MNGYDVGFAIGLLIALGMTMGHKRAWIWLGVWAASYVASTIYHRMGWPSPIVAGGALDIAAAYAVYIYGKTRWEMVVGRLFQAMLAVNIIFYAVTIQAGVWGLQVTPASLGHNVYALTLDLLNIAVLIWIGVNGAQQEVGSGNREALPPRRGLRGTIQAFQRQRTHPPFWSHQRWKTSEAKSPRGLAPLAVPPLRSSIPLQRPALKPHAASSLHGSSAISGLM